MDRTPRQPEQIMVTRDAEIFIRESLRPDLTAVFGPVDDLKSPGAVVVDPSAIIRFSSCKESSTDGKEDTKKKEIGKDDKGIGISAAARGQTGPVTDVSAQEGSIILPCLAASAHANVFA